MSTCTCNRRQGGGISLGLSLDLTTEFFQHSGPPLIMIGMFLTAFPPILGYSSFVTMSGIVSDTFLFHSHAHYGYQLSAECHLILGYTQERKIEQATRHRLRHMRAATLLDPPLDQTFLFFVSVFSSTSTSLSFAFVSYIRD